MIFDFRRLCQVGNTYADLSLRKRLASLTARQKSDEGEMLPLVHSPAGETPAMWALAAQKK